MTGANRLHQSLMVMTRGDAGFLTGKSGREVACATYVMQAPMKTIDDIFTVLADVGSVVEAFYEVTLGNTDRSRTLLYALRP